MSSPGWHLLKALEGKESVGDLPQKDVICDHPDGKKGILEKMTPWNSILLAGQVFSTT